MKQFVREHLTLFVAIYSFLFLALVDSVYLFTRSDWAEGALIGTIGALPMVGVAFIAKGTKKLCTSSAFMMVLSLVNNFVVHRIVR